MRTLVVACLLFFGCKGAEPDRLPHQLPATLGGAPPPAKVEALASVDPGAKPRSLEKVDEHPEAPAPEPGEDVLAEVKGWQMEPNPKPPSAFRAGHVTPRHLPESALTTRDEGFEVKLPSGAPITTPTAYDGKVFVSGGFHSKEFYAVEAKTGKLVWGLDLDDDGPSTAACADGVCAFNTESCTIFTVDAATGKQLWSAWLGDPLTSAPAIADGRVFTSYPAPGHAHATHLIVAFELKSGKILWQRWIDSDVQSAPVVTEGKVFASTFGGSLYRFDPASGEILSARRVRATSAPTVAGGTVLYSARSDADGQPAQEGLAFVPAHGTPTVVAKKDAAYLDARVQTQSKLAATSLALDAGNGFGGGAPAAANPQAALMNVGKHNVSSMQAHQGSRALAIADNVVAAMGDEVVCNDRKTGERRWSYQVSGDMHGEGGALVTAPAAAGGSVFVGTLGGDVLRMDPKSGKEQARWKVGSVIRSQPIMVDGWIYVGTEDGRLVGIDTGQADVTGWATWGGDAARTGLAAAAD